MKRLLTLMAVMTAFIASALAQRTASGYVYSVSDDQPVIGATVLVKGTKIGTATDLDGNFTIDNLPATAKTLVISYIGMHPVEVTIGTNLRVGLQTDSKSLDEVMVVAYGTAKKSEYTGSASVVKADQLQNAVVADVTSALSGKVSGVQVQSYNGQPGTAPTIRIRGVGSINAVNDPLYVVDGVPYEGDMSTINPQDVESMTILKDAASTALYGARGANGVILITTKKGKTGNAKVTFDARWGSNSRAVPKYDVVDDSREYLSMTYTALRNAAVNHLGYSDAAANVYGNQRLWSSIGYQTWTVPAGQNMFGIDGMMNPNATEGYVAGSHYYIADDWAKESLSDGFRQEYNLGIQGGNDKFNYYVSGAYLSDSGIISNSNFDRFSTRATVDYQAKSWLKIGTNLAYIYTKSDYPGDNTSDSALSSGNAFNMSNNIGPVYPMYVRDAEGNIEYNTVYNRPIFDYGDGKSTPYTRNVMSISNPAGSLLYDSEKYLSDVLDAKWYAILTPVEGLTLSGNAGYYVDNTRLHYVRNGLYGQGVSSGGEAEQVQYRTRSLNLQGLASYTKTFADVHNMDLMVGYESYDYNYEQVWAIGSNLYNPNNWTVDNTIDQKKGGGYALNYRTRGIFARAKYNFDERYFFMASYRRDASSRFAPDHRWGDFFSVSGAWDMAKESFMHNVTWVDQLKLKASFGQNGNDRIGLSDYYYYAWADQYHMTGSDGVFSDATLSFKGNPDITWETSNASNFGVDFALWNGTVTGTVEYFNRQTSNMLFNIPVAPSLGYSSIPMNVGSMRNNGWEIELNYSPINTKDITWDINANVTFASNKVLKLAPYLNGQWITGSRIFREGESMYQLYTVKYAGVDPEDGQALYWARKETGEDEAGNKIYEGEEYKTNEYMAAYYSNRCSTGNIMPKAYGGFGTNLKVYGFDASVTFAYQVGGRVYDNSYATFMSSYGTSDIGFNYHKDLRNAWTPSNTNTDVPRLDTQDQYVGSTSDRYLVSSNFLSLNNITVGYTLPDRIFGRTGINGVRIYFAAENVALWTKRKGLDPRQDFVSSNTATYSPIRAITGGIHFSF